MPEENKGAPAAGKKPDAAAAKPEPAKAEAEKKPAASASPQKPASTDKQQANQPNQPSPQQASADKQQTGQQGQPNQPQTPAATPPGQPAAPEKKPRKPRKPAKKKNFRHKLVALVEKNERLSEWALAWNAGLKAAGREARCEIMRMPLRRCLAEINARNDFVGGYVDLALAEEAFALVKERKPAARRIEAVDCVVRKRGGGLAGDFAFLGALAVALKKQDFKGKKALVLGAGPVGRAVASVLAQSCASVAVVDKKEIARAAAGLLSLKSKLLVAGDEWRNLTYHLKAADVVVNTIAKPRVFAGQFKKASQPITAIDLSKEGALAKAAKKAGKGVVELQDLKTAYALAAFKSACGAGAGAKGVAAAKEALSKEQEQLGLAAVVKEKELEAALEAKLKAEETADAVELRLDCLRRPWRNVERLLEKRGKPVIAVAKPRKLGGCFKGSEAERAKLLEKAAKLGAEFAEVEWAMQQRHRDHAIASIRRTGCKVILAFYWLDKTPERAAFKAAVKQAKRLKVILKLAALARNRVEGKRMQLGLESAQEEYIPTIAVPTGLKFGVKRAEMLLRGSYAEYVVPFAKKAGPGEVDAAGFAELLKKVKYKKRVIEKMQE